MHTIELITGLSNSGKTTYSQQYENVYHLDDGFTVDQLELGQDIVIEGVFISKKQRKEILDKVKDADYRKICVWIDTPLITCLQRNAQRREFPDSVIFYQAQRFVAPTEDEGWDEIIRITDYNPEN